MSIMTSVRRAPVQERSAGTVHQILRAASDLLQKEPLEEITTSRIAQAADVSIGGLYRFFPDKQSIVDAVAVKHVEDLRSMLERELASSPMDDGPAFLGVVVDAYVAFLDGRPDFRAIALGQHVSARTRSRHASPEVGPAALVKSFILEGLGFDLGDLDLKLRVASEAGERLIAYAFEQPPGDGRAAVITEMKAMLSRYIFGESSSASSSK